MTDEQERVCDICKGPIPPEKRSDAKRCSEECDRERERERKRERYRTDSEYRERERERKKERKRDRFAAEAHLPCSVDGCDDSRRELSERCNFHTKVYSQAYKHKLDVGFLLSQYEIQGYICKWSGCSETDLEVDHDHDKNLMEPGYFRGLLCRKHNDSLGKVGDNLEGLEEFYRTAREYLVESKILLYDVAV